MNEYVRGTKDIEGKEANFINNLEIIMNQVAKKYNISKIYFPILNFTEIFKSSGELSDIVSKELYSFKDKSQRNISLSPEYTALAVRSFINNNKDTPYFIYYIMPCFRYQKPQSGVRREFYQLGIELINFHNKDKALKIMTDIIYEIFKKIKDIYSFKKEFCLEINTINSQYTGVIKKILSEFNINLFCKTCNMRILRGNFLRVLDCKICSHKILTDNNIFDLHNKKTTEYIDSIDINKNLKIISNYKLVRGIDYYKDIVFELLLKSENKSILGGGFYEFDISKNQNFKKTIFKFKNKNIITGVGFAVGINRIFELLLK